MSQHLTDEQRAELLGVSLDEFYRTMADGVDPVAYLEKQLAKTKQAFYPPAAVKATARKLLKWKEKHGSLPGVSQAAWLRVKALASGRAISPRLVEQMAKLSAAANLTPKDPKKPWIDSAYNKMLSFGGPTGIVWATKTVSSMKPGVGGMDSYFYGDEHDVPVKRGMPQETKVFDALNIDIYWDRVPSTDEEKAVFHGFHIHSKDNPYGLHTHVIGGKLGGAHKHGPQNRRGAHTHAVDLDELATNYLIHPNAPVYLDGEHEHLSNAPDGPHSHAPQTFG